MALTSGTRLGAYEIAASIGAGGMGEVFRARDQRLNRDVALKVLPELFAADPDRLARFRREAQVLASLNHPNIAAIHGFEEAGGVQALVLELVEGPTLADRIAQGALPLDEALPIARQIAEALEAAHEHGIVHRDLKPANIKVRPDGTVKVLDFGLAKAFESEAVSSGALSMSPTITSPAMMTGVGMILGTAAYMAPEQARGKPVDKRSDIWAFGCVLYEMLTGVRAFEGEEISDTLAAVLRAEPQWKLLPANTPHAIRRLLRRALEKDRKQRLSDIADGRLDIMEALTISDADIAAGQSASGRRYKWFATLTALAVTGLLASSVTFFVMRSQGESVTPMRFELFAPPSTTITNNPASPMPSLSPDGRTLAFVVSRAGQNNLAIRSLDKLEAELIPGTVGAVDPFWSPDSRFIGFFADGKLKMIDLAGGRPQVICDAGLPQGGTWNRDGTIVFAAGTPWRLFRVSAAGDTETPTRLEQGLPDGSQTHPSFLPDGRHFVYLEIGVGTTAPSKIYTGTLDSVERTELIASDSKAVYANDHLLFVRDGQLRAQPFDVDSLRIIGDSFPLQEVGVNALTGRSAFSVSPNGILTFRAGTPTERSQLTWLDRSGRSLATVGDPIDQTNIELSPDVTRVAISVLDPAVNTRDVAIYDLTRDGLRTRFTFDPADEWNFAWSPDGGRLAFNSNRKGMLDIYQKSANGTGPEDLLFSDNQNKYLDGWSADGQFILFTATSATTNNDIWMLPLGGDRQPVPLVQTPFSEGDPRISPDGRWLAYRSNETGTGAEIFVVPLSMPGQSSAVTPVTAGKWRVSTGGGEWPRWRADGEELFYRAPDNTLMAATVSGAGAEFKVGAVRPLFKIRPRTLAVQTYGTEHNFDVSSDGQRFLVNTVTEQTTAGSSLTVVLNWMEGLKN